MATTTTITKITKMGAILLLLATTGCELIDPPPADPYARAQWQAKYAGIQSGLNNAARNWSMVESANRRNDTWVAPAYNPPQGYRITPIGQGYYNVQPY